MSPFLFRRWKLATIPRIGPIYLHATAPTAVFLALLLSGRSETLLTWIGLWCAAAVHALGHTAAALRKGETPESVTLFPFFSTIRLAHPPVRMTTDMLVTAAGPMANATIGAAMAAISSEMLDGKPDWFARWAGLQIGYGFVSLLPMYPLDGARLLRIGLQWRMPETKARETAAFIGQASAAAVVLWSLYQGFYALALGGVVMYVIGRFALVIQSTIRQLNDLERTGQSVTEDDVIEDDGTTITMTMTEEGVWEAVEGLPANESRIFF